MGNQNSIGEQLCDQNYHIIEKGTEDDNILKLQDVNTGQPYIHKKLDSNDEEDAATILEIIEEKINDPSPFVIKLHQFRSSIEKSYCSSKTIFYVLFQMADRTLKDEITERRNRKYRFTDTQINLVIDNISKALFYLYKVGHQHCFVNSQNISWPVTFSQTVLLNDPWAIPESRISIIRRQRKIQQEEKPHQNDLYNLGLVILQMINASNQKQLTTKMLLNKISNKTIKYKLQVLLSKPSERMKIYDIMTKETNFRQSTNTSQNKRINSYSSLTDYFAPSPPTESQKYVLMNNQQHRKNPQTNYQEFHPSLNQKPPLNFQKQKIVSNQQINYPLPTLNSNNPQKHFNPQSNTSFQPSTLIETPKQNIERNIPHPPKNDNLFTSPQFLKNIFSGNQIKPYSKKESLLNIPILAISLESSLKSEDSKSKQFDNEKKHNYKVEKINQRRNVIDEIPDEDSEQHFNEVVIEHYTNGSCYEGQKFNGMRNGKGKFYYEEGSYYDGEWENNKMHGHGKLYYANGRLAYDGQWVNDEFNGFGKVYNDVYEIKDEMFDYQNLNLVSGKWKYYEGNLISDSKEGMGKIVFLNGECYEGSFMNDRFHGQGKYIRKNGEVIHGIWQNSFLEKVL